MTKIDVATQVRLNDTGRWGAFFLIASPIASAILYPLLGNAMASNAPGSAANVILLGIALLACCVAFFFSIVMIVVGREYSHQIEIQRE